MQISLIPLLVERIQQFGLVDKVGILTFYSRRELLVQVKQIEPEIQTSAIIINPMANFLKKAEAINVNQDCSSAGVKSITSVSITLSSHIR